LKNSECTEDWFHERCNLLAGINPALPYFPHFLLIFIKFGTGTVDKHQLDACDIYETRQSEQWQESYSTGK
jgi:hypothetical protein